MSKNGELVIRDNRALFRGEGSTGLATRDAEKQAEAVLDTKSHALKDDAVAVPLGDRVTVKRIAEVELSAHGIVIPQTGKQAPSFGVVTGVGQGRYNLVGQLIPLRVQVGAVVMFGRFSGTDLPLFGVANKNAEPLLCLREEEIMLVLMTKEQYANMQGMNPDPEIAGVANEPH